MLCVQARIIVCRQHINSSVGMRAFRFRFLFAFCFMCRCLAVLCVHVFVSRSLFTTFVCCSESFSARITVFLVFSALQRIVFLFAFSLCACYSGRYLFSTIAAVSHSVSVLCVSVCAQVRSVLCYHELLSHQNTQNIHCDIFQSKSVCAVCSFSLFLVRLFLFASCSPIFFFNRTRLVLITAASVSMCADSCASLLFCPIIAAVFVFVCVSMRVNGSNMEQCWAGPTWAT